jgi:hypothetical protein
MASPLLPFASRLLATSLLWLTLAEAGCRGAAIDPPDTATSPQATAEPAPLANVTAATNPTALPFGSADAGARPEPMRSESPLPPDTPHEPVRDAGGKESVRDPKELPGYVLQAALRTGEGPPPPRGPEVNSAAIDAARRRLEAHVSIELSQTRARFVLTGGFVLPQGTELRARADRYGHLVFWPGEDTYRVAQPGALRSLLGERRLDVAPISPAELVSSRDEGHRLGFRTRRLDLATRAASASIEVGLLRDAGEGGVLVCRLLLDLMSAPPSTSACGIDEVPLHAELRWMTRGTLTFDVAGVVRRGDIQVTDLAVPPATTSFTADAPPSAGAETLLTRADLVAFRSAPIDLPPQVNRDAEMAPGDTGLLLVNSSDELRVAWVDGVPLAWVGPGERMVIPSLQRGRYMLQWRTFLGDAWEQPETVLVPGSSEVGRADAAARL